MRASRTSARRKLPSWFLRTIGMIGPNGDGPQAMLGDWAGASGHVDGIPTGTPVRPWRRSSTASAPRSPSTGRVTHARRHARPAEHLGYDKHDPVGRNRGNSRNGTRTQMVRTEIGPVEIERAPRPRRHGGCVCVAVCFSPSDILHGLCIARGAR